MLLKDILEKVVVKESIRLKEGLRIYELQLHYLPRKSYSNNTNVATSRILRYVETKLLNRIMQTLKKELKNNYSSELVLQNDSGNTSRPPGLDENVDNVGETNNVSLLS